MPGRRVYEMALSTATTFLLQDLAVLHLVRSLSHHGSPTVVAVGSPETVRLGASINSIRRFDPASSRTFDTVQFLISRADTIHVSSESASRVLSPIVQRVSI